MNIRLRLDHISGAEHLRFNSTEIRPRSEHPEPVLGCPKRQDRVSCPAVLAWLNLAALGQIRSNSMFTSMRFAAVFLALNWFVDGPASRPAAAVTVEVARKCKVLTDAAFPPREPGNPAAGSAKGSGRAAQNYFEKCVANGGKT